jgi:hypothetical protein
LSARERKKEKIVKPNPIRDREVLWTLMRVRSAASRVLWKARAVRIAAMRSPALISVWLIDSPFG